MLSMQPWPPRSFGEADPLGLRFTAFCPTARKSLTYTFEAAWSPGLAEARRGGPRASSVGEQATAEGVLDEEPLDVGGGKSNCSSQYRFESVDVMRVRNGKITDHWGV